MWSITVNGEQFSAALSEVAGLLGRQKTDASLPVELTYAQGVIILTGGASSGFMRLPVDVLYMSGDPVEAVMIPAQLLARLPRLTGDVQIVIDEHRSTIKSGRSEFPLTLITDRPLTPTPDVEALCRVDAKTFADLVTTTAGFGKVKPGDAPPRGIIYTWVTYGEKDVAIRCAAYDGAMIGTRTMRAELIPGHTVVAEDILGIVQSSTPMLRAIAQLGPEATLVRNNMVAGLMWDSGAMVLMPTTQIDRASSIERFLEAAVTANHGRFIRVSTKTFRDAVKNLTTYSGDSKICTLVWRGDTMVIESELDLEKGRIGRVEVPGYTASGPYNDDEPEEQASVSAEGLIRLLSVIPEKVVELYSPISAERTQMRQFRCYPVVDSEDATGSTLEDGETIAEHATVLSVYAKQEVASETGV